MMFRINVIHDVFRTPALGVVSCVENARWIEALLRRAVAGLPITVRRHAGVSDGGAIDEHAALRAFGLAPTKEGWAALCNVDGLGDLETLDPVFDADLVVGFGLTPAMIRALAARHVCVVDLEISPLRFCAPVPFRARTNHPVLSDRLSRLSVDPVDMRSSADALIGLSAALNDPGDIAGRIGLFCGQTLVDLSTVVDGRTATVQDEPIFEQVRRLAATVDLLHVAPHPAMGDDIGNVMRLFTELPNALLAERPTYAYLAAARPVFVAALSSSVLSEAPWFDLKPERLIVPDRDNRDCLPRELTDWMDVTPALFRREVWAALAERTERFDTPPKGGRSPIEVRFGDTARVMTEHYRFRPLPRFENAVVTGFAAGASGAAALRAGWHTPEDWGCWSRGGFSVMMFRCNAVDSISVTIDLQPFEQCEVQWRPLFSTAGFRPLEFARGPGADGFGALAIGALPCRSGIAGIVFRVPEPRSPATSTGSADARVLGLAVRSLTVGDGR